MATHHINQKTGRINICRAKPGHCPLKKEDGKQAPHFKTKEEAHQFIEQELKQKHGNVKILSKDNNHQSEKIRPENIKEASWTINDYDNTLLYPNSDAFDYDYDYDYTNHIDEDTVVLRAVNADELARQLLKDNRHRSKYSEKDYAEVKEILEKIGALDPAHYEYEIERNVSFYDDDINEDEDNNDGNEYYLREYPSVDKVLFIAKHGDIINKFKAEYYKKPNAKDVSGILSYVRSKGQYTTGLSPIQAIKEQLQKENPGRSSFLVDKANYVSSKKVKLDDVLIGADRHYENIEPLDMKPANESDKIAGVVFYDPKIKKYKLIDGYHRTKGLKNNNAQSSQYIVLSEKPLHNN